MSALAISKKTPAAGKTLNVTRPAASVKPSDLPYGEIPDGGPIEKLLDGKLTDWQLANLKLGTTPVFEEALRAHSGQ